MRSIILAFLLVGLTLSVSAQALQQDSIYGIDGTFTHATAPITLTPLRAFQHIDSSLLIGAAERDGSINSYRIHAIRVDRCGSLDTSFADSGTLRIRFSQRTEPHDYATYLNGQFLAAGRMAINNNASEIRIHCSRWNADGSLDSSFAQNGVFEGQALPVTACAAQTVNLQLGDHILLTGNNIRPTSQPGSFLMRLKPNGTLDSTFGTNGYHLEKDIVLAHARLQSDDKIIIVGEDRTTENLRIQRHLVNGALDVSFGTNGVTIVARKFYSGNEPIVRIDAQDRIYVGMEQDSALNPTPSLTRFTKDGLVDSSFSGDGVAYFGGAANQFQGLEINSEVIVTGRVRSNSRLWMTKLNMDGTLHTGFNQTGEFTGLVLGGGVESTATALDHGTKGMDVVGSLSGSRFYVSRYNHNPNKPVISQSGFDLTSTGNGTFTWYLDSTELVGQTGSTITAQDSGTYYVVLTSPDGCQISSKPFYVSEGAPSSVRGWTASGIQLYPNPASGFTTVALPEGHRSNVRLTLFDMQGHALAVQQGVDGQASYRFAMPTDCAPGMYVIRIEAGTMRASLPLAVH